jgi:YlmC/YmxH family sporulation protein
MRLADLQVKDVVNMKDGKKLGKIIDAEINNNGQIMYFVVEQKKFFRFFSSNLEVNVTFNQITKIGEDVILVEL